MKLYRAGRHYDYESNDTLGVFSTFDKARKALLDNYVPDEIQHEVDLQPHRNWENYWEYARSWLEGKGMKGDIIYIEGCTLDEVIT